MQPGQGQTVRVAGVEVGRIADVELEDGVAVVELDIEHDYENLIREDATALLRPKTALKDMFLEVDPGHRDACSPEGGRITVGELAAGHRPGRDLRGARRGHAAVPEAARVRAPGKGLRGRGDDLREVFRRLEPIHRDLARVTRATRPPPRGAEAR